MSRRTLLHATALAALLTFVAGASFAADALAPPVERTLPNGLRVLVLTRPRLPLVTVQVMVPGGSALDPPGLEGTAAVTAQMLRASTTSRTADELATAIARLGGNVTAQTSRDYGELTGTFLSGDLEAGFEIMSNAVLDPLFSAEDLERLRDRTLRPQLESRSTPSALADDAVLALGFADRPYGRPMFGTPRSIEALTRENLRAYYRDVWRPDHAILAVVGDVTPERAVAVASDWFGRWEGRAAATPRVAAPEPPAAPRLALLDQPGMGWAEIRLALLLPARRTGDEAAASLAAAAFAAGPLSRLSRLPGGVGGSAPRAAVTSVREGGLLTVSLAVPVDSAAAAIRRLRAELRAFTAAPPARTELAPVQHQLEASFPFGFETLAGAASQWQVAYLQGLSAAQLVGTPARFAAVTVPDVAAAANRWFDPEHALVVVAGPADRLKPALAALGAVEMLTESARAPIVAGADTIAAPTTERLARGRALVARALAAHGGEAKVRGVHDSQTGGQMLVRMQGQDGLSGRFTEVRKEPFRLLSILRIVTLETRQVLDGDKGWMQSDPDSLGAPVDSVGVEGLRRTFEGDMPHLLIAAADPAAKVVFRGSDPPSPTATDAVDVVTARGERRRYHFEQSTGRLVEMDEFETADPVSKVLVRTRFSNWSTVDGIAWPLREERLAPGDNIVRVDVESVRLNQGVSDVNFMRPVPGR